MRGGAHRYCWSEAVASDVHQMGAGSMPGDASCRLSPSVASGFAFARPRRHGSLRSPLAQPARAMRVYSRCPFQGGLAAERVSVRGHVSVIVPFPVCFGSRHRLHRDSGRAGTILACVDIVLLVVYR